MIKFRLQLILLIIFSGIMKSAYSQEASGSGTIILGAGHAYYMNWQELEGFKRNASVPGFTSRQLGWTLNYSVISHHPSICILQTGPEDLLQGISAVKILDNLSKISMELENDSIRLILISGIQNPTKKLMPALKELNDQIKIWAEENGIQFIDISDLVYSPAAFDEDYIIKDIYQKRIVSRINRKIKEHFYFQEIEIDSLNNKSETKTGIE